MSSAGCDERRVPHTLLKMQSLLGLIRRRRSSAAFVALFFTLITLVATAHQHQGSGLCRPAAAAEHGGVNLCGAPPACSLCEWLTLPSLPPTHQSIPLQATALCLRVLFVLPVFACFALPVPRRCPRAPPVSLPHPTVA